MTYETFDPSLIVLDLQYPNGDGIEAMSFLKRRDCQVPIVLISGFDTRVLETARRVGIEHGLAVVEALVKPIRADALGRVLEAASRAGGRRVGSRSGPGNRT